MEAYRAGLPDSQMGERYQVRPAGQERAHAASHVDLRGGPWSFAPPAVTRDQVAKTSDVH